MKSRSLLVTIILLFIATTVSEKTSAQACTPSAPQTYTNSTPVAIVDNTVVTSTILVSGAPTYLYDLNIQTFITHTFPGDLDITITSPSGTVVTLTTDNGGGSDDVFNGTIWDDNANPGGQVPYTTNNGLVTDHAYVNLTLASPLVPEEALGAFIGEDPNGIWTISISDDAGGDVGNLASWSLILQTLSAAPTLTTFSFSNTTPVSIVDNTVVTSTINVSGAGTQIFDVNFLTNISHTFAGDLDITITSPSGTVVTLTTDNGGGSDNVFAGTLWDDNANPGGQVPYTSNNGLVTDQAYVNLTVATPLVPEEALAAFIGEDPNGTWTLSIGDDAGGDVGTLNSWGLDIKTSACPPTLTTCSPGVPLTFTNNTPVAIVDNTTVTSTINVAGAPTYLYDLNVQTFITHTFASDLDITITSPAGTVVTLTTDNGGGFDNVFNGTIWDDNANPGGQVPYTTNNGLVTDHAYVNLTLASPLVPEEALGAFIGENPNGTWTISISDDAGGDVGSLNSWSLMMTGLNSAPTLATTSASNTTPVSIVDNTVVSSTINISGAGTQIFDVNLMTNITHTFAGDLDITLTSPAGTVVTLTTDNGAGNDNVFAGTLWDDNANPGGQVPYTTNNGLVTDQAYVNLTVATPLVPEEALAAFIGEDPNGIWTLRISDDAGGDVGTLNSWSLDIKTSLCTPPTCIITCPANITVSNDPDQCGAVVNYPAPTTSGTCGTITATPASGSFFPVGTTTVTATSSMGGGSCSFTITVNDTQSPVITCPANITVGNTPGQCGAFVNFTPIATDNCPGVVVTSVPASGSLFPVGTTMVTSTATDASGNIATCTFTVTVNDTEPPIFGSPQLIPELLYYKFDGSGSSVPNLASSPPAGTTNATIIGGQTQGTSPLCGTGSLIGNGGSGTTNYVNTGWATNFNGSWTISFKTSAIPPSATLFYVFGDAGAGSFRCFTNGVAGPNNWMLRGTGITDVIATGAATMATHTTTFVRDVSAGNIKAYVDGVLVSTVAQGTISNSSAGPFRVGGYTGTTGLPSNGLMDEFGIFNRALSASEVADLAGCPMLASTCPSPIVVNNDPGVCGATVNYTTPTATDNCAGVTTTQTQGMPTGSVFPVGTTTNSFLATDAAGNTAVCTFTITVNDGEPPVLTCPANQTRPTPATLCTYTASGTEFDAAVTDNCPGVTKAYSLSGVTTGTGTALAGKVFNIGATTVTWTATDAAGNTSSCSFVVTITDGNLPVINTQPTNKIACEGDNTIFSVGATSPAAIAYQWQQWDGTAWVNISGAINSSYTVNNTTIAMNANSFRVILTSICGNTVTSNMASLYVNKLPVISLTTSRSPALIPGQFVTISAIVTPGGGTIIWRKNGVVMPGYGAFSIANLTVDDIGTYNATYTDLNGCVKTSADISITAQSNDNLFVYPNPNSGQFQVRFFNQANQQVTLTVYDSRGAKGYQRSVVTSALAYTRMDVNINKHASDVYVVELRDSGGKRIGSKKVIVGH